MHDETQTSPEPLRDGTPDPQSDSAPAVPAPAVARDLPPAALRALAEAEERRRAAPPPNLPPELGGRNGPEPVRYGDWEKKGIAIDF